MSLDKKQYSYANDLLKLYKSGDHKQLLDLSGKLQYKLTKNPIAHDIIAASNLALGNIEKAIHHYLKSLGIAPNNPEACLNLGLIYTDLGQYEGALDYFSKAIKLDSDYPEAHFGIANIYQLQKFYRKAIQKYRAVLDLKPGYGEALNNLGATFLEYGKPKEAIPVLTKLVEYKPKHGDALYNLGLAYKLIGDDQQAIKNFALAVITDPKNLSFWETLGSALSAQGVSNLPYDNFYEIIFLDLLNKKTTHNPHIIAPVILHFLEKDPAFAKHINRNLELVARPDDYLDMIKDFSKIPLLLSLMELCPIADVRVEKIFTECRKVILLGCNQLSGNNNISIFVHALAVQCHINEYVYWQTDEEKNKLVQIIEEIHQELEERENRGITNKIAIIACYSPLTKFSWCDKIQQTPANEKLLINQVHNVLREKTLSRNIPTKKKITNQISLKVKNQYEVNPYPHWVNTTVISEPKRLYDVLVGIGLSITDNLKKINAPEIFIAGCGTGKHAVFTASRFKNARVTAIDLSLRSLSYAKRKSDEFGLKNINYIQADILTYEDKPEKYDVIESSGVLHHMQSPETGLNKLAILLKPGGLMRLGLYSEYARQLIATIRNLILEQGMTGTFEEKIRLFRKSVIFEDNSQNEEVRQIIKWNDFYSMSECRDLLFHVKEHRFTLPAIKALLEKIGLKFIGFEFQNNIVIDDFNSKFKEKNAALSLDLWDQYEKEKPETFTGMYQFWVRKSF